MSDVMLSPAMTTAVTENNGATEKTVAAAAAAPPPSQQHQRPLLPSPLQQSREKLSSSSNSNNNDNSPTSSVTLTSNKEEGDSTGKITTTPPTPTAAPTTTSSAMTNGMDGEKCGNTNNNKEVENINGTTSSNDVAVAAASSTITANNCDNTSSSIACTTDVNVVDQEKVDQDDTMQALEYCSNDDITCTITHGAANDGDERSGPTPADSSSTAGVAAADTDSCCNDDDDDEDHVAATATAPMTTTAATTTTTTIPPTKLGESMEESENETAENDNDYSVANDKVMKGGETMMMNVSDDDRVDAAAAPTKTTTTTSPMMMMMVEPTEQLLNEAENGPVGASVTDIFMNGDTSNGESLAAAAAAATTTCNVVGHEKSRSTSNSPNETDNVKGLSAAADVAAAATSNEGEASQTDTTAAAAAAATANDADTSEPPVVQKLRRSTRTKHSRIGASYQAAELPPVAHGLLVLPSPSEHRIKHNLILNNKSSSSSDSDAESIRSRHGEVLWDPIKAQRALDRMGHDNVDALDDFVKKAKELSVRTMLMASLHQSDYNPDVAMHEFKRALAATPGRGKDLTVHVSDIERLELAEIFEDQTSTFKDFQGIAKSTGYSMQKVLVQYYQWKGRRQKDYIMCKGRRKDSDWCDVCNDGGTLILCDLCKKGFHLKCLDPPLTRMPKGDWYCRNCLLKSPARIRHSSDGRSCKHVTSSGNGVARREQQQKQQQIMGMQKTSWPLSIMSSDKHAQKVSSNKGSSSSNSNRQPKQPPAIPRATTTNAVSAKPNYKSAKQLAQNKKQEAAGAARLASTIGKDVESKASKKRKNRHPTRLPTEPRANDESSKPVAVAAGKGTTKGNQKDAKRSQQPQQDQPNSLQQSGKKSKQQDKKRSPYVGTSDQPIALLDDSSDEDNNDDNNRPAKRSKPSIAAAGTGAAKQTGDRDQKREKSSANSSRTNGQPKDKKSKDTKKLEKADKKAKRKREKEENDLYTVIVPVTKEGLLIKIANVKIGVIFTGYRRFQNGDVGPVEANNLFKERGDLIVSVDGTWIVDKTWQETQRLLTQHNGRRERMFIVKRGAGKDYFEDTSPDSKRRPP